MTGIGVEDTSTVIGNNFVPRHDLPTRDDGLTISTTPRRVIGVCGIEVNLHGCIPIH